MSDPISFCVIVPTPSLADEVRDFLAAGAPGIDVHPDADEERRGWCVARKVTRRRAQDIRRQLETLGIDVEVLLEDEPVAPASAAPEPAPVPVTDAPNPWGTLLSQPQTPDALTPSPAPTPSPASSLAPAPEAATEDQGMLSWFGDAAPVPETSDLLPSEQVNAAPAPDLPPSEWIGAGPELSPPPTLPEPPPTFQAPPAHARARPTAQKHRRSMSPEQAHLLRRSLWWNRLVPGIGLVVLGKPEGALMELLKAPLVIPWMRSVKAFNADVERIQRGAMPPPPLPQKSDLLRHTGVWIVWLAAFVSIILFLIPSAPTSGPPLRSKARGHVTKSPPKPRPPKKTKPQPESLKPSIAVAPNPKKTAKPPKPVSRDPGDLQREITDLLLRGKLALAQGEYSECMELVGQVIELDPGRTEAYQLFASAKAAQAAAKNPTQKESLSPKKNDPQQQPPQERRLPLPDDVVLPSHQNMPPSFLPR